MTVPLLKQLVMEYNGIIHTASSTFFEKDIEELLGDEESEDDSIVFDTIDNQLNGVEDEMMLMLSNMSSKRKRITCNEVRNDKRKKKYDMKKLHFTDPFTMERKLVTYH